MGKGIPDRWLDYSSCGDRISSDTIKTRFVSFKVPLKSSLSSTLPPESQFTPSDLLDTLQNKRLKLGLVIDLTFTTRYYDKWDIERSGINYEKIKCEGHIIPRKIHCDNFADIVGRFLEEQRDEDVLIGVHCTHGVNRTGYLVCRYMIDHMGVAPREAIDLFNKCRGHKQERANYIQHLLTSTPETEDYYSSESTSWSNPYQHPDLRSKQNYNISHSQTHNTSHSQTYNSYPDNAVRHSHHKHVWAGPYNAYTNGRTSYSPYNVPASRRSNQPDYSRSSGGRSYEYYNDESNYAQDTYSKITNTGPPRKYTQPVGHYDQGGRDFSNRFNRADEHFNEGLPVRPRYQTGVSTYSRSTNQSVKMRVDCPSDHADIAQWERQHNTSSGDRTSSLRRECSIDKRLFLNQVLEVNDSRSGSRLRKRKFDQDTDPGEAGQWSASSSKRNPARP